MRTLLLAGLLAIVCSGLAAPIHAQVVRTGPAACRSVALTFDMCPVKGGAGYDAALVDMLIAHKIPATFFVSGRWALGHDPEVRALLAVPYFELGTHGHAHAHLPLLAAGDQREEIQRAVALLSSRYGRTATLFRPPYGEFDAVTEAVTRSLGLQFILWSIVSGDPDPHLSAEAMLNAVTPRIRNGSILVFHGNGKGRQTHRVVETLYREVLQRKGLRPVTISELLKGCGGPDGGR